jgi:hypothetical protein
MDAGCCLRHLSGSIQIFPSIILSKFCFPAQSAYFCPDFSEGITFAISQHLPFGVNPFESVF